MIKIHGGETAYGECMCNVYTKLDCNANWHDQIHNGDSIELYIPDHHEALHPITHNLNLTHMDYSGQHSTPKLNSSTTDETYKSNTIKQSIAQNEPYFSANPNFLHRHVERRFVSQQTCYVQVQIKLTSRSTMIMEITETMMAAVQILHHELTIVRRGVNHWL